MPSVKINPESDKNTRNEMSLTAAGHIKLTKFQILLLKLIYYKNRCGYAHFPVNFTDCHKTFSQKTTNVSF